MFGLGQEVGCNFLGVGGSIGHHEGFGWPGKLVDVNGAVDATFGEDDEEVSRTEDLVDLRYGLSAVRHRAYCLRAAQFEDTMDACDVRGNEHLRTLSSVRIRSGAEDNFLHPGNAGWNGSHQDGRWVGATSGRCVEADAVEWTHDLAKCFAEIEPGSVGLLPVKPFDTISCNPEVGDELRRNVLVGGFDLLT